jgi:hypothetical protein
MPSKSFIASLLDLSFTSMITPRVARVVYAIVLLGIGATALVLVAGAFTQSAALGAVTLFVLAPMLSLFYAVVARVSLEFAVAAVRTMEMNAELVALQRRG